jgi:SAM-dependent methyltransferase
MLDTLLSIDIPDMRAEHHPEYHCRDDLRRHIRTAYSKLRHDSLTEAQLDDLCSLPKALDRHSLGERWKYVLVDALSVLREKNRVSYAYETYKERYESIELLMSAIPIKMNGKTGEGPLGLTRFPYLSLMSSMLREVDSPRILDVGCGYGSSMLMIKHLLPHSTVHGCEYTHGRVASALVNLRETDMVNNIFLADATDLSEIEDRSYDIVSSFHVLEQLGQEAAGAALGEMWRICSRALIIDEPTLANASLYEGWRIKRLGYPRDLLKFAEVLPQGTLRHHGESRCRSRLNTSNIFAIERTQ